MNSPTEPTTLYEIGGRHWARGAPGFADAIAQAHENHLRPRCLCQHGEPGVDMYVARVLNGYTVKRMPNTGSQHATTCPSYEPPAEFSGLGPLVGTAIVENPAKEIVPSRYGHKAILKHIPDQAFALDEPLYRRLGRCFEQELSAWGTDGDLHLLMIATFRVDHAGVPILVELSLMLASAQWLPVEDGWEKQLVGALVRNGRCFIKSLRYNEAPNQPLVTASLLDCGEAPRPLLIARDRGQSEHMPPDFISQTTRGDIPLWQWNPVDGDMPALPPQQNRQPASPLP